VNSKAPDANTEKIAENKLTIKNNSITLVSLKCNTDVTLPFAALVRPSSISQLKWVSRSDYLIKETNLELRKNWQTVGTLSLLVKRTSTYVLKENNTITLTKSKVAEKINFRERLMFANSGITCFKTQSISHEEVDSRQS